MREGCFTGELYHVFNRSIAKYVIFASSEERKRMVAAFFYYRYANRLTPFYRYYNFEQEKDPFLRCETLAKEEDKLVRIIAYCIMPTHIHLILKQVKDKGISMFMNNVQNSYTRYFNLKHKRKGPLWEGPFKSVLIADDSHLLHLTRYIHLNPVSAEIVNVPCDWEESSYGEYISPKKEGGFCEYKDLMEIRPQEYEGFVKDRIGYQRNLEKIKHLCFE